MYERFGQLGTLLDKMEDFDEPSPEYESLLKQATEIWEEIKDWYYE